VAAAVQAYQQAPVHGEPAQGEPAAAR